MRSTSVRSAVRLLIAGLTALALPALAQMPLPGGLVVTVTSPAPGATVSGAVAVAASVSGAASAVVAGVQFKLDGANLGAEDAAAPYATTWNSSVSSNGIHTLTAIARDVNGVPYTSGPVTVTVSNAPPPPAPPSTRFEETAPAVTYGAGWTPDSSRSWSGGAAAASATPGAQAVFSFVGTSVSWIGGRAAGTGIARVYVDGVLLGEVDTYSKTEEIRVPMFTASGLADTAHTLAIEVTGRMNASSTSSLIVVDAFDVPARTISRLQETDPEVAYEGAWVQDNAVTQLIPGFTTGRTQGSSLRTWSAGAAKLSTTAGARATFAFTGTAVNWLGARGTQSGIARVYLDGAFVAEVDAYSPTEQIQAPVFSAADLADGRHTLTIEVTGARNPAAEMNVIVIDGFDVTKSGTRVQETNPAIVYGTGWIPDNRDKAYSEGVTAETNASGAQASFTFSGTGVDWIGARGPQTGIARVFLDGVLADEIDMYFPTEGPQHTVFSARGLAPGTHTLTIEVMGHTNAASTDRWILIDAFDVIP